MKKTKSKTQFVRIDSRTVIEIPIDKDPEFAKEQFIRKRVESDKFYLRWGNKK